MRIIIMRPETILQQRPDTFSQTVLVATDSSCSSTADHTYYDSYPFVQFLKSPKPAGFFSDVLTLENEAGRG